MKVENTQPFFLSPEECQKLLSACEPLGRDIIHFTLNTGLRFGEVTALMWSDVDFENKILTVQRAFYRGELGSTKTNRIRKIPLSHGAIKILAGMKQNKNGFIFTNRSGLPFIHTHCDKIIKKAAIRAGLHKIGWHTLRHTFASNLANNGVAIQQIQALLGHTDIKTTMRYSHIAPTSLVEAVSKLDLGDNFGHNVVTNPFLPTKNRQEILRKVVQNSA